MSKQNANVISLTADAEKVDLQIGGFVPFSLSDYPGELAAVVFCQGCRWRCRYCHNPHLQKGKSSGPRFEEILCFLEKRRGLLDAVVFSGGEPIFQSHIVVALNAVKQMGFKVGLHTSGASAVLFEEILPYVDWIGLDIKSLPDDYPAISKIDNSGMEVFNCLSSVLQSGKSYEVRTTYHPVLFSEEKLLKLAQLLAELGVKNFALQIFRITGCLDKELLETLASCSTSTIKQIETLFPQFVLRS